MTEHEHESTPTSNMDEHIISTYVNLPFQNCEQFGDFKQRTDLAKSDDNKFGENSNNKAEINRENLYAKINKKRPQNLKRKNRSNETKSTRKEGNVYCDDLYRNSKKLGKKPRMYGAYLSYESDSWKDKTLPTLGAGSDIFEQKEKNTERNRDINIYCGFTLDNLHTPGGHNSSIASIKTDRLREGLTSIDNPLYQEEVSTDECQLTLSDETMEEERIKRTLVTVNVPDYYLYQSEELEIHSKVPPHSSRGYPVYIPKPDYEHSSNLSTELSVEDHRLSALPQTQTSDSKKITRKNKHRKKDKGKSKKKSKRSPPGAALKSTVPEPDFPTLRSLTEDERYLIYGRFPVKKPKDYRWLSAVSFAMNCILGLVAINYSIKSEDAFEAGRFTRAKQEGKKACYCALLAIFVTLACVTVVLLYLFVF